MPAASGRYRLDPLLGVSESLRGYSLVRLGYSGMKGELLGAFSAERDGHTYRTQHSVPLRHGPPYGSHRELENRPLNSQFTREFSNVPIVHCSTNIITAIINNNNNGKKISFSLLYNNAKIFIFQVANLDPVK